MICMFINDAIWWNTAAFVTYFVDWYFIYIIRGNFIKFANKYVKECFVIYILWMSLWVTQWLLLYMTYDRRIQVGFPGNDCNMHDMWQMCFCLAHVYFTLLIVSRDHYALLYNIVCLIVLFVRKINWNIAGSLKTLSHDEDHL